jgi:lipopolysaccharide transport system ATP-binding protein
MSSEIAIKVESLSKCYQIYEQPHDRLKQFVLPRLQRWAGLTPKRYYREFWALKDVSFEVKKGETVGIIGRNGSGKSTLLQMICGTLNPTGGTVQANGRIAALLELGSGFNTEFTGRENVYLNGTMLGLSKAEIDLRFDAITAFAEIGDFIDQPVKTYSSGMYVRLAFAIQANVDPEILVIDEALAVGDAYFVHRCMLRFNELQRNGTTILFVSHDANTVRNLCSRVIWMEDGRLVANGGASNVVDTYLASLFGQKILDENQIRNTSWTSAHQNAPSKIDIESSIPNIDRRLGDQKIEIVGVGLYDESMNRISSILNEMTVILRMTVINQTLDSQKKLAVGYIFRNSKGQEIASISSLFEGRVIKAPTKGDCITIRMKLTLPRLYPGSYAFTVTAGYVNEEGDVTMSDRIENALVFDILSKKRVQVMMAFPTEFEIEG